MEVAGLILTGRVLRKEVSTNNASSITINAKNYAPEGIPCRWELVGGKWHDKTICYAEGVCRSYNEYSHAVVNSSIGISSTVSMDTDGNLTVSFGTQLSYARLYLYNGY